MTVENISWSSLQKNVAGPGWDQTCEPLITNWCTVDGATKAGMGIKIRVKFQRKIWN